MANLRAGTLYFRVTCSDGKKLLKKQEDLLRAHGKAHFWNPGPTQITNLSQKP